MEQDALGSGVVTIPGRVKKNDLTLEFAICFSGLGGIQLKVGLNDLGCLFLP